MTFTVQAKGVTSWVSSRIEQYDADYKLFKSAFRYDTNWQADWQLLEVSVVLWIPSGELNQLEGKIFQRNAVASLLDNLTDGTAGWLVWSIYNFVNKIA